MISVVICSVNPQLAAQVKRNINETIGVPFQLLLIENNEGNGICAVYNRGASKAEYEIICFVHEDVLFNTKNWGYVVVKHFEADETLAALGIAGSKGKTKTPSGWSTGLPDFDCCNILHINKAGKEHKIYANPDRANLLQEVVTLDGVFICTRKELWAASPFDEKLLRGFHLYDLDFSFRLSKQNRVAVCYEIDLIHLTEGGDFGNNWVDYTLLWHKNNEANLPKTVQPDKSPEEIIVAKKWLHRLKSEKISWKNRLRWLAASSALQHPKLWPHIMVFLGHRIYKRRPAHG